MPRGRNVQAAGPLPATMKTETAWSPMTCCGRFVRDAFDRSARRLRRRLASSLLVHRPLCRHTGRDAARRPRAARRRLERHARPRLYVGHRRRPLFADLSRQRGRPGPLFAVSLVDARRGHDARDLEPSRRPHCRVGRDRHRFAPAPHVLFEATPSRDRRSQEVPAESGREHQLLLLARARACRNRIAAHRRGERIRAIEQDALTVPPPRDGAARS